jgi:hypothetical protein
MILYNRNPSQNFPLITTAIFTGELYNPWRCGSCATKKQRESVKNQVAEKFAPVNTCCRKCGIDL